MTTAVDPKSLPDLDPDREIPSDLSAHYQANGHATVRALASAEEVAAYHEHICRAGLMKHAEAKPLKERDTYHKAFLQTGNLWEFDEAVKKFSFAKRFAKVAAQLMGVDGVRMYHDQALFKEPGGGHTPWHQDQYYWPLDTMNTITMWMPLVDCPSEMGAMVFASGSGKEGCFAHMHISDESEAFFNRFVIEREFPLATNELHAGDATFHSGWTLHKAPGNSTNRRRDVMTIIYMDAETRVHEPRNQHQPADLERWLDNRPAGALADGALNPIVWHKDWER